MKGHIHILIILLIMLPPLIWIWGLSFTSTVNNLNIGVDITRKMFNNTKYQPPIQLQNNIINMWIDISRFIVNIMMTLLIILIIAWLTLALEALTHT